MTLSIRAHGRTIRIHDMDRRSKIGQCFRKGVPYEHPLCEYVYSLSLKGLAVDAGANIGNHALWFAIVCDLDVITFEPIQYRRLRENVALNALEDRIRVVTAGLGDTEESIAHVGKGRLNPNDHHDSEKSGHLDGDSGMWIGHGGVVQIHTLDSYELDNVTLIKIDVEGMEPYVLRGGEKTIRRNRPIIFAETWGATEDASIGGVLEPWGYRRGRKFTGHQQEWLPQ